MRNAVILVLALAVPALVARADGDDPEPPGKGGPELRKLKGKWTSARLKFKGNDREWKTATYVFDGEKLTVETGKVKYVAKVKVDAKKKPLTLELTREDTKATTKMAFKLDKGELFLAPTSRGEAKGEEDFSGDNRPVMVLTRVKK